MKKSLIAVVGFGALSIFKIALMFLMGAKPDGLLLIGGIGFIISLGNYLANEKPSAPEKAAAPAIEHQSPSQFKFTKTERSNTKRHMVLSKVVLLYWFSVVILIAAGYWFIYRPYDITKVCMQEALYHVEEVQGDQTDAHYFFWKCQRQHGIPE